MEFAVTDIPIHFSDVSLRRPWLAALLGRSLHRAMMARSIRRTLNALPDAVLHDIGLTRSEIVAVASKLASDEVAARDAAAGLERSAPRAALRYATATAVAVSAVVIASQAMLARGTQMERGKLFVALAISPNLCAILV